MGAITALRRAAGAPPVPPSPARQALAAAIAAAGNARERLARLTAAQAAAADEADSAEAALGAARQQAEEAGEQAAQHRIERLLGGEPRAAPTRAEAAARLAAATEAATDAQAARTAIRREVDTLARGEREQAQRVADAARAVLRAELAEAGANLCGELLGLHAAMVDRGRALMWLWRQGVVDERPGGDFAGARQLLSFPPDVSARWHAREASPSEGRLQAAFDALKHDAAADLAI